MTRDQIERAVVTSAHPMGRVRQLGRAAAVQYYLDIGGPRLSAPAAAERCRVTKRTVERWRRALREAP
jgi:predicted DNA-binding transcriptional regulator YafY